MVELSNEGGMVLQMSGPCTLRGKRLIVHVWVQVVYYPVILNLWCAFQSCTPLQRGPTGLNFKPYPLFCLHE